MHLLKYLFLFLASLIVQNTFASCPHPTTFSGIAHKPFPATVCYPESGGGTGYCNFQVIDSGLDIKVPCTNPDGCSSDAYAIDFKSLSSTVYPNSDCTKPPLDDNCYQQENGSIYCNEEEENPDNVLQCSNNYCPNPENKRCPTGYSAGSAFGQNMCVKNDLPPDPDPQPCTGDSCENQNNQATIDAVNEANYSITTSVINMTNTLSDYLQNIKNKLSELVEKISQLDFSSSNNNGSNENQNENIDTSSMNAEVPTQSIQQQQISTDLFAQNSQCPQDAVLNLHGFTYTFSYSKICEALNMLSYLVMLIAYIYAASIVSRS